MTHPVDAPRARRLADAGLVAGLALLALAAIEWWRVPEVAALPERPPALVLGHVRERSDVAGADLPAPAGATGIPDPFGRIEFTTESASAGEVASANGGAADAGAPAGDALPRLSGVVATGEGTGAAVLVASGGARLVRVGAPVDGWTLARVGRRSATITRGDSSVTLHLPPTLARGTAP